MNIFLSYASEDRDVAEEIQLALSGAGHRVFYDKASLPAAGDYHGRIQQAVREADAFVFLISPASVGKGSYSLTELKFARDKWPHPRGYVVPVRLHDTPFAAIPAYLKSITLLEPEGNVAAEVAAAVAAIATERRPNEPSKGAVAEPVPVAAGQREPKRRTWVWIGVAAAIAVAIAIENWDMLIDGGSPPDAGETPGIGIQGPGAPGAQAPASGPPPVAGDDQTAAARAATEIVRSIRSGEFDRLWTAQTSAYFKSRFTRETFFADLAMWRQQLGPPLNSQLVDTGYTQQDPVTGVRAEIYSFNYLTAYSAGRFVERIVVVKEADGRFRLGGLWRVPAP